MRAFFNDRWPSRAMVLALACVATMTYVGCGGNKDNETIIPEEPPAEKARDSMDYYRNQMGQGGS